MTTLKILIAIPLAIYTLLVFAYFCLPNKYVTYTMNGRATSLPVSGDVFWAMKIKLFFILWACIIAFGILWYIPL